MADRLRITELDFDTIKQNLKTFLNQQSEFTDYDFEGSGLSVLLDILAYNTHYNAYYLNMVANESFLDTAILRDSVVSHAKTLGYLPYSMTCPVATINFTANSSSNTADTLTLPAGYIFMSNLIDWKIQSQQNQILLSILKILRYMRVIIPLIIIVIMQRQIQNRFSHYQMQI
jgi:hypothetical protein